MACLKENVYWRNNILWKGHRKGGVITLQVEDLISSSGLKKLYAHFYHALNVLLWDTKCCARKQFLSNALEGYLGRNEFKVFISPMENKLACLANSLGSFQIPTRSVFLHCGALKHQKSLSTRHCIQKSV